MIYISTLAQIILGVMVTLGLAVGLLFTYQNRQKCDTYVTPVSSDVNEGVCNKFGVYSVFTTTISMVAATITCFIFALFSYLVIFGVHPILISVANDTGVIEVHTVCMNDLPEGDIMTRPVQVTENNSIDLNYHAILDYNSTYYFLSLDKTPKVKELVADRQTGKEYYLIYTNGVHYTVEPVEDSDGKEVVYDPHRFMYLVIQCTLLL